MGKFDIEPHRGVTDPDKESYIRVRTKVRKNNIKRASDEKSKENKDKEFGKDLAIFT